MASVVLHIKDSYYFEVPKAAWPVAYSDKADFPGVWVRLDPDFQLWEAARLYPKYASLRGAEAASLDGLKKEYVAWKLNHANAGKPFADFLVEQKDAKWFQGHLSQPENAAAWQQAVGDARDVTAYKADPEVKWAPEKIQAYNHHLSGKILIPQPMGELRNLYQQESGFCISKFMVIELVVCLMLCLVFGWLAKRVVGGDRPRGRVWNLLEVFVLFIRDQVCASGDRASRRGQVRAVAVDAVLFYPRLQFDGPATVVGIADCCLWRHRRPRRSDLWHGYCVRFPEARPGRLFRQYGAED